MTPLTAEWVEKAEEDFAVARREARVRISPSHSAVCFHAQQCAEKYLKGRLAEDNAPIERTHDLPKLLMEVAKLDPVLLIVDPAARVLVDYAVRSRYPGSPPPSRIEARAALNHAALIRDAVRRSLGLPPPKPKRKRAKRAPRRSKSSKRRKA